MVGDFNDDGRDDLAIGVPFEQLGGKGAVGAVNVIYGSKSGLTASSNNWFRQGVSGNAEAGDEFGTALAVGDFDGDGYDDLAMGAPGDSVSGKNRAGVVQVIYGSEDGLKTAGNLKLTQAGIVFGIPAKGDRFRDALAAGDFDGDGRDDLAVGVSGEAWGARARTGKVQVFYGSPDGVSTSGQQKWTQWTDGVPVAAQKFERFGSSLAAGDFDDDGFFDLAIGAPNEGVNGAKRAGSVTVLIGSPGGLTAAGSKQFRAGVGGLVGSSVAGDNLGATLRAADLNGDGYQDLAIGIPGKDLVATNAGAVIVVYGRAAGLVRNGSQVWHQGVSGVAGTAQAGDTMGVVTG